MDVLEAHVADLPSFPHPKPALAARGVLVYDYSKVLAKTATARFKQEIQSEVEHRDLDRGSFDAASQSLRDTAGPL